MYRYITRYDVGRVDAEADAAPKSCIDRRTVIATEQGPMTAEEVVRHVEAGRRVSFSHRNEHGVLVSNPVLDAIRTEAPGRTIVFADGRRIKLTGGHVLPVGAHWDDGNAEDGATVVRQQEIILAQDVEVGDRLLDGVVAEIVEHDHIEAVRLWTAIPRWITTADGLTVGTRWHEVVVGWACSSDEDEYAPYDEVMGLIRLSHPTPGAPLALAWEESGAFKVETNDVPQMICGAGLAPTIRRTIAARGGCLGDGVEVPPALFVRRAPPILSVAPTTLGQACPQLAAIRSSLGLRILAAEDMSPALRGGAEVSDWSATA